MFKPFEYDELMIIFKTKNNSEKMTGTLLIFDQEK
jgi:hypothetical protein